MVAIAIGVFAGLIHFYEQLLLHPTYGGRALNGFLLLSAIVIGLIVPYLWSDWLQRRGIQYFEVFVVIVLGLGAVSSFTHGRPYRGTLSAVISLMGTIAILPRLFRSVNKYRGATNHRTIEAEVDKPSQQTGPRQSARYFGMLIVWFIFMELCWSQVKGPIPTWILTVYLLPMVWLAWKVIFHLFKRATDSSDANLSIKSSYNKGGRA
jgi:hypothetical protein